MKEVNDDICEMVAILDAILNFSKCSRLTKVHPADFENGPPGLPKTIKKKTYTDISRFSKNMPLGSRTTDRRHDNSMDLMLLRQSCNSRGLRSHYSE